MAMSREEIFEKVQEVLVEALGVEDDEVTEEATLIGDLGAESIDFLDIIFHLQKAFNIEIPREELFAAESVVNNPEYISNGKLTDQALTELETRMPHIDITELKQDPDVNKIPDLFTVSAIVNFLDTKVNG